MSTDIIIRVGASLDRSVEATFRAFERRAQQSGARMMQGFAGGGRGGSGPEMQAARDVYRERSRLNRQIFSEEVKASREAGKIASAEARKSSREHMRSLREREREERRIQSNMMAMDRQRSAANVRTWNQEQRELSRASRRRERDIDRFATRTSHRTTRFLFPRPEGAIGMAQRVGYDLMRGAGLDTNIGSSIGRARELQSAGGGLAAQERIATGGKTKGGAHYAEMAESVAGKLAADPAQIVELMRSFTGKTGQFDQLASITERLSSMAIASGANLGEMGDAAGLVYNQLAMLPDAADRTIDVMRGIAGQTAMGAVEMKDYASQIGRIAAQANKFEGSASDNILKMSALTQLAMASGGASSPADAARALVAFTDTFGKGERINAFANEGINIFADQTTKGRGTKRKITGTRIRDPLALIEDALTKTGGDIPRMSKLFASVLGVKPVRALATTYQNAGGGAGGIEAIRKMFGGFMGAGMSKDVERANLADRSKGIEAKAQAFQNQLDKIVSVAAMKLIPALEQLAPVALKVAEGFSSVVRWAAENPGKAITLAITGSIMRAGIESGFRAAIDKMLTRLGGVGGGGGPGGGGTAGAGGGGSRGGLGGALAAGGLGLVLGGAVYSAIDLAGKTQFDTAKKGTDETMKNLVNVHGPELGMALAEAQSKLTKMKEDKGIFGGAMDFFGAGTASEIGGLEELIARKKAELADFEKRGELSPEVKASMAAQQQQADWATQMKPEDIGRSVADSLGSKTIRVNVTNMPSSGFGGDASVNEENRMGP
jgi:hypothetical protein